ncbi:MAG: TIGR00341 family protein [Neomegalonema sp.]|nr:TIGR00341 family protein [Neomegalonema sp.]
MAVRVLEIIAPKENQERIEAALAEAHAIEIWRSIARESDQQCDDEDENRGRAVVRALVETGDQACIDAVQDALSGRKDWRILILPVDAAIPMPERDEEREPDATAKEKKRKAEAREVLYNTVAKGAVIDLSYILFVALSTVVAAVALTSSNVAVLIGAMVIAPFLGPFLAFALGAALGDRALMSNALKAAGLGAAISLSMSILLGFLIPSSALEAKELVDRTSVDIEGIVVALASGACAALALTSGASASLVGVMVAVALLPPAVTAGIMLGAGHIADALGAFSLLLANVASVVISALAIYKIKGIAPRRWYEKQEAERAQRRTWFVWGALLLLLMVMILVRSMGWAKI